MKGSAVSPASRHFTSKSNSASSSAVYSCALLRDILLQGRLYISRNWLCFYANLFGKDIKVSPELVPVCDLEHRQLSKRDKGRCWL